MNFHETLLAFTTCFVLYCNVNAQQQASSLKDRDGNVYPIKLMQDNKNWMTINLNLNIQGSYCYENMEQRCRQYGRLYTWKAAKEACKILGDAWRLPTDIEWREMAKNYGGVFDDSVDSGKTAYRSLLSGGNAGFNVLLGGARRAVSNEYARVEAHGFYWTATESDMGYVWYYNFGKGSGRLFRQKEGEKEMAISVRCISDPVTH
jgi:uncharacterized protein (TIGR02145 family)